MRLILAVAALLAATQAKANNYYFSSSTGNDSRSIEQASNPATPFKSIDKLNEVFSQFQPGDSVLFLRGDVFTGTIIISRSGNVTQPIVLGAYGEGDKPVISGFATLSNWIHTGNNLFETTNTLLASAVHTLVVNGAQKPSGRYPNADAPNKGYLTYETATSNIQITDLQLPALPNWSGGEVVIRKNRWTLDRNKILRHAGNLISYTSASHYAADPAFGYFIQNHPATLDQQGEWCYDPGTKKISIYWPGSRPPEAMIKAGAVSSLVSINNKSDIKFEHLLFEGANENTFDIIQGRQITVDQCDVLYSGINAFKIVNSSYINIENGLFQYSNNSAVIATNCTNLIIRDNKVNCTGIYPGMGEGDAGGYEALLLSGSDMLIQRNQIDSTGYIPITFNGNDISIFNNVINNFDFIKDDGGGIYTYNGSSAPASNSNRKIYGNIVLNGLGAPQGTSNAAMSYASGIYMDDKTNHVDIADNTVANCSLYGLYLHNANDINVQKNTLFNNARQLGVIHDNIAPDNPIRRVNILHNIFFSKSASSVVAEYKTIRNDLANFGTIDSNYYCRPMDEVLVINSAYKNNNKTFHNETDLEGWKHLSGKDLASKQSPFLIAANIINSTVGDNKFTNGSFTSNISGLYAWAARGNAAATWSSNAIDEGSLKVSFSGITNTSNKASVIIGIGAIGAGKKYVLRFSLKGSNDYTSLQCYLRKSIADYADLSERKDVLIKGFRTENELVFTATADQSAASIVFDLAEQANPVYLDNIRLLEAEVTAVDADQKIRFEYNTKNLLQRIILDDGYFGVDNKSYQDRTGLSPFSSLILLRPGGDTVEQVSPSNCTATGSVLLQHWDNNIGNNVADIPLQIPPQQTTDVTSVEYSGIGINYGSRLQGYLCPPQTGNYTFYISGDDAAELWLSTNDAVDNKVKIASFLSWTAFHQLDKFPSQTSVPVQLISGQKYYIEVLHKQGSGDDHLTVAWRLPDGSLQIPLPNDVMSIYSPLAFTRSNDPANFTNVLHLNLAIPFLNSLF